MRCPRCQKLYSVQASVVQKAGQAGQSLQFVCQSCEVRFAIPFAIPGQNLTVPNPHHPANDLEPLLETYEIERLPGSFNPTERTALVRAPVVSELHCPKCRALNPLNATECRSCGVIFAKYQPSATREPSTIADISHAGRRDLADLWDRVMANYADPAVHTEFIQRCFESNFLPFAATKYARILGVTPTEEIAQSMRQRIIGLGSFRAEVASDRALWNVRIPKMNDLILVLGGAAIVIGLMLPHAKGTAVVGLIGIVVAVGLRYLSKPR